MRRVFRLVPAMWLAILLAYVIAQWRGIPSGVNLGMFGKTLISRICLLWCRCGR